MIPIQNTQPIIIPITIGKKQYYELIEDYACYFIVNSKIYKLLIYAGFVYDGASIPWIVKPILRVGIDGPHRGGTLFHDFIYMIEKIKIGKTLYSKISTDCHHVLYEQKNNEWVNSELSMNRATCDRIMFEIMWSTPSADLKQYQVNLMRFGIKVGGNRYWKRHSPKTVINYKKC